jgi:hypothetical protein
MPRPRKTPLPAPPTPAESKALAGYSPEAQRLFSDVSSSWDLHAPARALLENVCELLSRAEALERIVQAEGLVVSDGHGGVKSHPAETASRSARSLAQAGLAKLMATLGAP